MARQVFGNRPPSFLVGFASSNEKRIQELVDAAPSSLKKRRTFTIADKEERRGQSILKETPTEDDVTHPVLEHYRGDRAHFFCMYDTASHGSGSKLGLDAVRAAMFIEKIANAVAVEEPIQKIEGGRRHLTIDSRYRNSALARRCKERDGYRCQVCHFHFEEILRLDRSTLR